MTEHKSIAAALAAAQSQMGKALKDASNPHFRSKYADLSSVTGACLPALNANGIAVIQPTGADEDGRYVETILLHTTGEKLSCRVPLIVQRNDMQGYGSAVTYARRYGLMCMAGIAPEDDDGYAATAAAPKSDVAPVDRKRGPSPADHAISSLAGAETLDQLAAIWGDLPVGLKSLPEVRGTKDNRKAELRAADADDFIPGEYEGKTNAA